MVVFYKGWRFIYVGVREDEGADVGEDDYRAGSKEKELLPEFPLAI